MVQYLGMVREPLPVATMLTPAERIRVDAAGEGSYFTLHRDSVAELVQDLKTNRAGAVVLSVARLLGQAIRSIHEETSVSSLFV